MIRIKSNLASGIASLILGLALYFIIPSQISAEFSKNVSGVDSKTIPTMIAILFIVCGIILIFQSLVLKKDEVRELAVKEECKTLAYMAVLVVYAYAFNFGFIASTSVLAVLTLAFSKCKKPLYYIITVLAVFLLYGVFKILLHVPLP